MTTRTRHNITLVGIVLAVGFAVVIVAILMHPDRKPSSSVQNIPVAAAESGLVLPLVHLEGRWTGTENDTTFNATVSGNDIKIEMETIDGTSATYWHGTFKTSESSGAVVTSSKTEASDEIVISQSSTKEFTVGENQLTFKFSALGFSKNVAMSRA